MAEEDCEEDPWADAIEEGEDEDLAAGLDDFIAAAEEDAELDVQGEQEEDAEEDPWAEMAEPECVDPSAEDVEPWQSEDQEADADEVDVEVEEDEDDECFAWDGEEAEAAISSVDADLSFEGINESSQQDGQEESELLSRLRRDLTRFWLADSFELEPFGSYVTDLGLSDGDGSGRSDLDVVLLFHGQRADSFEAKDVRSRIVSPTIDRLGSWLRTQPGITVKNVIRHARVPIVTFETAKVAVDISVQQPYGVLNSWHLRDLCRSGWPGRLKALARMTKLWAKSKGIHTAKDGALSSYGYVMLVASYLQDRCILPALLPKKPGSSSSSPYMDADEALDHVLSSCSSTKSVGSHSCNAWRAVQPMTPNGKSDHAGNDPEQLFRSWLDWMAGTVMGFVGKSNGVPGGCGVMPLPQRHIVSVRKRSQEELRADVSWSTKREQHWTPQANEVFMLIEEPLNGENVARCVKSAGFWAIRAEIERAQNFLKKVQTGKSPPFRALLALPPLSKRPQPPSGVGLPPPVRGMQHPIGVNKRPREEAARRQASTGPPQKRQMVAPHLAAQYRHVPVVGGHPALGAGPCRPGAYPGQAAARLAGARAIGVHARHPAPRPVQCAIGARPSARPAPPRGPPPHLRQPPRPVSWSGGAAYQGGSRPSGWSRGSLPR